jgi:ABC-type sugar transport system permease subunit
VYVWAQYRGNNYVRKYSASNVKGGYSAQKMLCAITNASEGSGASAVTYKKLEPLQKNPLSFNATEEYIYIFVDGGMMLKVGTQLRDTTMDGEAVDYFPLAQVQTQGFDWNAVYAQEEKNYFLDKLLKKLNSETPEYTEEQLDGADVEQIIEWYKALGGTVRANDRQKAKDQAKVEADKALQERMPWCYQCETDSVGGVKSILLEDRYLDETQYAVAKWDATINGAIYSKKNQTAYFANATDGYVYAVEKADLDGLHNAAFINDVAKKIESSYCGAGRSFSSFGNGISNNEFANTLFIKYESERTISILDLNDKENYEIIYTYTGAYNAYSLTGDADNETNLIWRRVEVTALDGTTVTYHYLCSYEPVLYQNKTLTTWAMVICLAFAVVSGIAGAWMFFALKTDVGMYKVKCIQRDFHKNKYVYLALVFFVILLMMFCYYEAIGAISMSFFNYTREEPTWIWNNFGNYLKVFQSDFWPSVDNMLFFLVFDLVLGIAPPVIFAFLLILIRNKTASNWIRSLMFIPGIIPSMASMLIWREGIYGAYGIFNQLVPGDTIPFLSNDDYSRLSLILMGFPFVGGYLIFYGGMMNIPHEYHEAGWLEGLGVVKRFLLIDIPLIMPQIKYIFIMTFIGSVQNYARTYILKSAGTTTVVEKMYRAMMEEANYGLASAYATLIFVFLFFAVAMNFKMQKKDTMGEDL